MRRVVSVFLPTWPIDRLRRASPASFPDGPVVTARHENQRQVIDSACSVAKTLGLRPGMSVAKAQMLVPDLRVADTDAAAQTLGLRRLAVWARCCSPLTAADPPDGLWLETTGCDHLHGGEAAMLEALCGHLARNGIAARAAVADTPGAAHALARHAATSQTVAMGDPASLLAPLPVACLRLPPETLAALHRVGLERVGQIIALPRAPLARRFGTDLVRGLDQALGHLFEPIAPLLPPVAFAHRMAFLEPLLTAESLKTVIAQLAGPVCAALERDGQGARTLDLLFQGVDGAWQAIRIGAARPTRSAGHLTRLLIERLPGIDPGLGVEAMQLVVTLTEPLAYAQTSNESTEGAAGVAELVDRLVARLGPDAVYRAAPVNSDVPERAIRRVAPLSPPARASWPSRLARPARLLVPPQPIQVTAMLPDYPPAQFIWRRARHLVRRAEGPERVRGEWWRREAEIWAVRDYFVVEDDAGRRWWLLRRGNGVDAESGDMKWFLQGVF